MDPIEILEKVNAFYSEAFNKLITITALIIGFGGFILPIIFQYFQSLSLKREREILKSQILDEVSKDLISKLKKKRYYYGRNTKKSWLLPKVV